MSVMDFLDRAETVYRDRVAVVDEPDQPAPSWGELTFGELAGRARALAAGLDELGVGAGERVAMVSHNSARLLTAFWGVSGFGRVLVPVNFRLSAEEVAYIVEHSGASVLLVDPELEDEPRRRRREAPVRDRHRGRRRAAPARRRARGRGRPTRRRPPPINYTSGTTARPKGVQLTHRNIWMNAATFGWHAGVSDRDVYLHTLPMFHCNGWGMPYATCGMGVNQIVLRKVDGAEILRRVERHGVTLLCGAPAVVAAILDAASTWDGPDPGRRPHPHGRRRRAAAHPHDRAGGDRARLGVHPDLRPHRDRAAAHHEPRPRRVGRPLAGRPGRASSAGPARRPSASGSGVDGQGEVLARGNHVLEGYWEQPEATADAIVDGWFHTGDGGSSTTRATSRSPTARRT